MGFCNCFAKTFLIFFNLIIFIVGVAFVACGALALIGTREGGLDYIRDGYDKVLEALPEIMKKSNWTNVPEKGFVAAENLNLDDILLPGAIAFIVVGGVLLLLTILAFVGACCNKVCALATYAAIIIFILLLEVVLVILFFVAKDTFETEAQLTLKKSIRADYMGIRGGNGISVAWNFAHLYFKCCGSSGAVDFVQAVKWNKTAEVNSEGNSTTSTVQLKIPLTCCKMSGEFPDISPADPKCGAKPTDDNSYQNKGCYKTILEIIEENKTYFIIAGAVLVAIELFAVIMSFIVICSERRTDKLPEKSVVT